MLDRVPGREVNPSPPLGRLVVVLGAVTGVVGGDLFPRSAGNGGGLVMNLRPWEGDPTRCTDVGGRNHVPVQIRCVCV